MKPSEVRDLLDLDAFAPTFTDAQREWLEHAIPGVAGDAEAQADDAKANGYNEGWDDAIREVRDRWEFREDSLSALLKQTCPVLRESDSIRGQLAEELRAYIRRSLP